MQMKKALFMDLASAILIWGCVREFIEAESEKL